MPGSVDLGDALRACRTAAEMSQRQLSDVSSVSLPMIRSVEQGLRGLSDESYQKLVHALQPRVRDAVLMDRLSNAYRSAGASAGPEEPATDGSVELIEALVGTDEQWARLSHTLMGVHADIRTRGGTDEGKRFIRFVSSMYLIMREGVRPAESVWKVVPEMRLALKAFPNNPLAFGEWCGDVSLLPYRAALAIAVAAWRDPTELPALLQYAGSPLRTPARRVRELLVGDRDIEEAADLADVWQPEDDQEDRP